MLGADPVQKVTLASSDLNKSLDYWIGLLGLEVFSDDKNGPSALLGYAEKQAKLELKNLGENRICSSLFFCLEHVEFLPIFTVRVLGDGEFFFTCFLLV